VTDTKAQEYLKSFPSRPRASLKDLYPAIGEQGLDLLNKMLVFNPYFRPAVDECIEHSYFQNIKNIIKEQVAEKEVYLPLEKEDNLSIPKLRELFLEEVQNFKNLKAH
jgi:serine/threonine protein kinase